METCIYKGIVTHRRFKPKRHFFSYKTFSIFFDLDELRELQKKISIFSFNKFNIFSFYNKDHGNRDGSNLKDWVIKNLKKYNINFKVSKIKLLCFPRIFGYVFNPLSIFYCYNENNELKAILYEVKNTFNEQHTYIFPVKENNKIITQSCNKKFYVSPFIEMETAYNFRLAEPKDTLSIFIKQTDSNGMLLSACQIGKKEQISTKKLVQNFFKHPMMTIKIIMAIHFEALMLWKKGIKLVKKNSKTKNDLSIEK
tara:strand:+ start:1160 stop:1921 length:762 start_codon:yes stop_codon:yes gene_type:complete